MALMIDRASLVRVGACRESLHWWDRAIGESTRRPITLPWLLELAGDMNDTTPFGYAPADFLEWAIRQWAELAAPPETVLPLADLLVALIGWRTFLPGVASALTVPTLTHAALAAALNQCYQTGGPAEELGWAALRYHYARGQRAGAVNLSDCRFWAAMVIVNLLRVGGVPGTRRALVALGHWLNSQEGDWDGGPTA